MPVKTLQKVSVIESVYAPPGKVDREAGVIRDVKILGKHSRNGREYSPQAILEACQRYEGARVNIDHPDKKAIKSARGTMEQWGWLEGCEVRDGEVYGNLFYLKSHPHTETLLELAERRPDKFGLSHDADCSGFHSGTKTIIESVEHVRSVDVVQRPATTSGLFEHEEADMPQTVRRTFKQILESAPVGTRGRKGLLKLLEMDGMADMGAMPVDLPTSDTSGSPDARGPDGTPEDQIWEAFRTAVISYLDDDSMDIPTTIQKVTDALQGFQDAFGSTTPGTDASTPAATTEGVDELRAELKQLRAENKALAILEQHDIQSSPGRIKAIIAVLESADDLNDVLSSLPKRTGAANAPNTPQRIEKPRRSAPLVEGIEDQTAKSGLPYKDRKQFVEMIR